MTIPTEETLRAGGIELSIVKGGAGKPLLILHDELGYPGWMTWNERLAEQRTLLIPLQPGFGKTPRSTGSAIIATLRASIRGCCGSMRLDPVDVIGFSAGGFIAAEMAAADPRIFARMVLVAPMGIKPQAGRNHGLLRADDPPPSARHRRRSR